MISKILHMQDFRQRIIAFAIDGIFETRKDRNTQPMDTTMAGAGVESRHATVQSPRQNLYF